ncbi:leucine-rich repeat-containing protein 75B-like [Bufo gargarizans]|uniref:leucine-rich repeat-containing protein 75B-like n=1 Tax=Bufo gargarizans TaxID=30331 RepID=UPI001CF45380|nr:leucine-rich repeat-containing protein 75B-like [Bufo gargarizans]
MGGRLSRQSSLEDEAEDVMDMGPLRGEAAGARSDFALTSLILNSERIPGVLRRNKPAPYVRRAAWIRDIQALVRDHKQERALHILKLLRKDLGLEGTFLNDILYKHVTFLNLVDPISHELLLSLARELQCPRKEQDQMKSTDRICRQLLYHLTPHSKWHRHSLPRRKSMACLKNSLQQKSSIESLDLSGIPLTPRDVQRVILYLQSHGDSLTTVDLSFTELTDSILSLALPALAVLPNITHLSLNGNRLSCATLKELSEAMKDSANFPSLSWVDLGNNVDICSMPQPLLLGLRRRLCQQNLLPTIPEAQDSDLSEGGIPMSFPLPWDR